MATKKRSYYQIDNEKRVITFDLSVKPTAAQKEFAELLISSGFAVRTKSEAKAKQMKTRVKGLPTDNEILTALAKDVKNLATYKEIKKIQGGKENYNGKNGFFAARSWYINEVASKKK